MKSKVQDECDYDEAAVEEERKDASDDEDIEEIDDENEASKEMNDEVKTEETDEKVLGVSNEYAQQYRYDKDNHLWCELTFQVKYDVTWHLVYDENTQFNHSFTA